MRVAILAGEKSGFVLADLLKKALKRLDTEGEAIEVDISQEVESICGIWEGVKKINRLLPVLNRVTGEVKRIHPDVVVPIGFPGLNVFLGRRCRKMGLKVIFIAPPQVWAWGRFRIKMLFGVADRWICLFKFEEKILQQAGMNAVYYGYPFLDGVKIRCSKEEVMKILGLPSWINYIVFLPGSRTNEIKFHQPLFINLFRQLRECYLALSGVIVGGEPIPNLPEGMIYTDEKFRHEVIHYARAAVAVSGTITAETALLETPMVVSYHLTQPSRFLARLMVRVPYFSIPNIVAGQKIVPEFLEPSRTVLFRTTVRLIEDEKYRQGMIANLQKLKKQFGPPGAIDKIAMDILRHRTANNLLRPLSRFNS